MNPLDEPGRYRNTDPGRFGARSVMFSRVNGVPGVSSFLWVGKLLVFEHDLHHCPIKPSSSAHHTGNVDFLTPNA
ncbi:hypothetical protein T484DRAFT_2929935 [Baffinella frigidus]|nr:hypothetical protein T484DRAFT_2929935 [Cryptophyta sp. CCMP2293]